MNKLCLLMNLAGLFATGAVSASNEILIAPVVPYADKDVATEDVQKECDWNKRMPEKLVKDSEGKLRISPTFSAESSPNRLELQTTALHTIGGGGLTGPKWIAMNGNLYKDGQLTGSFKALRRTIRGAFSGCKTLVSLGDELTGDIVDWLENPVMDAKLGDER